MEQLKGRFGLVVLLLTILALITFGRTFLAAERYHEDGSVKLWALNIGQGDAILTVVPGGQEILTDGGPDGTILSELQKAMPPGDKEIELVISTHNDADHLAGLNYVLQQYKVDKVWWTGAVHTTQTYKRFMRLLQEEQIPTEIVIAGSKVSFGDLHGIVISPFESFNGVTPSQQNAAGIVTFWQYGTQTFLLTGDVEAAQEQMMLSRGVIQHADILKVGHHGSHTSSTEAFLNAVTPHIAVISVGKNNRYGHPHQDVLERYQSLKIPVLRTDQQGTVEFSIFPDRFTYATHAH